MKVILNSISQVQDSVVSMNRLSFTTYGLNTMEVIVTSGTPRAKVELLLECGEDVLFEFGKTYELKLIEIKGG